MAAERAREETKKKKEARDERKTVFPWDEELLQTVPLHELTEYLTTFNI